MPKLHILFTGGGTGGHIYPLLAVAEELEALAAHEGIELEMRYLGVPETFQNELSVHRIRVQKILGSKLRRYFSLANFLDAPKFFISIFQALWKVYWYMPEVLFSKGGPGALAVVFACRFYRIPIIIHESDAVPGVANEISARYAKRIAVAFKKALASFEGKNVALIGNPIRHFLLGERDPKDTAKKLLGFDPQAPLVLVLGGSQGSTRVNDFVLDNIGEFIKRYQVLHQVGEKNYEEIKNELAFLLKDFLPEEKARYRIVPFFKEDLKDALSAADVVLTRAGSGTIFELAAFAKPAILIPLKESARDHQRENAYEFAETGAAVVLEEDNLLPNIFFNQLEKMLGNAEILAKMGEAAGRFARPNAAAAIAGEIIKLGKTYASQ